MSSLNPCLRGLRQLLMQDTTLATTCLTTEGWAKCATTWHWLMILSSTILSAACTLFFLACRFLPLVKVNRDSHQRQALKSWHNSQNIFSCGPLIAEALWFTISNALQQIRSNQIDQKHWMPFVQNQRTCLGWGVFSMQCDNQNDHCPISVILPKTKKTKDLEPR